MWAVGTILGRRYACEECFKQQDPQSGGEGNDTDDATADVPAGAKSRSSSTGSGSECNYVMQPATKQILMKNPGNILTLHLKRFEQNGMRMEKITKHVVRLYDPITMPL